MENRFRTWAEIDLTAMSQNFGVIRSLLGDCPVMAVVKGDAYGHGLAGCAEVLERCADACAAATAEEGLCLREHGFTKPVLLLGPVPEGCLPAAIAGGLTLTIGSAEYAAAVSRAAEQVGKPVSCHMKLDTGLNRTGFTWRESPAALPALSAVYSLPGLQITGVYTHLACPESEAEEYRAFTQLQLQRFRSACAAMEEAGLPTGVRHCCSTASALLLPETRMDLCRVGMMIYGQCFSREAICRYGLRPVMQWKSRVIQLRDVPAGESVGYGRTYRAEQEILEAVVSVGYADGYRRGYAGASVLIGGQAATVIGRVCMDYLLLDVTGLSHVAVGSEVTLLGEDGALRCTANDLADLCGSVSGEVTAAITARVPRIYRA